MAALAEHRGQQEGRQRHTRHETQHRWALRRVRAGPALDVRALPQDEIRAHARVAVRKGVPRRHVRRLHARAQGKGGRRAQGPRCVRKLRHGGAERGCAAEGCVRRDGGARDRPVRSARVETLAPLRSHPPPRAPPGERARGARVRGRGVEGLEVFSVWQAGGARPGGCRRVETLETLGAGRGGDA